jgi:Family of unknown function (DUF6340)
MFLERKTFAILIGLVCCIACNQVVYFPIDIKMPSEVTLGASKSNTVLVVDNTSPLLPVRNDIHMFDNRKEAVFLIDSLGIIFNTEFSEYLREKNFSNTVLYTTVSAGLAKQPGDSSTLSADTIQKLAREANADLVLSLDILDASTKYWSSKLDFFSYADSLQTNVRIGMNIFSPEGKRLAPVVQFTHSLMWDVYLKAVNRKKILDKALLKKGLNATVVQTADMVSDKLVPQWETKDRWYYLYPNDDMTAAASYVNRSEWVKAAKIWGRLYDEENNEVKLSKLASNIALANEMTDDVQNALNWINIAKEHAAKLSRSDRERLNSYEKQLKSRLEEFKKLDAVKQ